jgi:hypothetical protein
MTKPEKKKQIKQMISDFFKATDHTILTELRNTIYNEIGRLPMSSNDKHTLEEDMYLWTYNSDRYIENIKKDSLRANVTNDFSSMLKIIDVSLLGN